jgi:hypothetical protein
VKCYRKYIRDGESSRFIYYIEARDDPRLIEKFRWGYIRWSKVCGSRWARGILPWGKPDPPGVYFQSLEGLEEISPLEILVMTGVSPDEAIETSR